jgi:copper(I)-binding protein
VIRRAALVAVFGLLALAAQAHDYRAGNVRIQHPYAVPNAASATEAAAFIATLENTGKQPDRLLRASSPRAGRIELRQLDGGVPRPVAAIELPPGEPLKMRPGRGYMLQLLELKQPLKLGEQFALMLEFERGGKAEVRVDVQQPSRRAEESAHRH